MLLRQSYERADVDSPALACLASHLKGAARLPELGLPAPALSWTWIHGSKRHALYVELARAALIRRTKVGLPPSSSARQRQ
jgi:hypothetical protein